MRKVRYLFICAAVILLLVINCFPMVHYPSVQEYCGLIGSVDAGKFESLSPDFEIGADEDGRAVFKYPHRAFHTMKEMLSSGIKAIQKEYSLMPLNHLNYQVYMNAGWQMTVGTDEQLKQAALLTSFLDIYENSFIK